MMEEREWIAHLDACKVEAMSVKAYARRHGLSVDSLYYQRRKMMLSTMAPTSPTPSKAGEPSGLFTRLQVRTPVESPGDRPVHLRLGNGLHLEMPGLPPVDWLAALVRSESLR
jgi:transposase